MKFNLMKGGNNKSRKFWLTAQIYLVGILMPKEVHS